MLPPRVEGVVEERIGRLEERMREILAAGSIEGQSFTAQVVAKLHDMSEREILKYLSHELEKRHRLVKEGSTERIGRNWLSQFSFSQSMFQHYLYNEMSARERMILHGDADAMIAGGVPDVRAAWTHEIGGARIGLRAACGQAPGWRAGAVSAFGSPAGVLATDDLFAIDLGAVTDAAGLVSGVLAVVDREEGGREAIEQAGFPVVSLARARDLGLQP